MKYRQLLELLFVSWGPLVSACAPNSSPSLESSRTESPELARNSFVQVPAASTLADGTSGSPSLADRRFAQDAHRRNWVVRAPSIPGGAGAHAMAVGTLVMQDPDGSTRVVESGVATAGVDSEGNVAAAWQPPCGVVLLEAKRRTVLPGCAGWPRVSPSGRDVVFVRYDTTTTAGFPGERSMGIFNYDLKTGAETQLTQGPGDFAPWWLGDEVVVFGTSRSARAGLVAISRLEKVPRPFGPAESTDATQLPVPSEYPEVLVAAGRAKVIYRSDERNVVVEVALPNGDVLSTSVTPRGAQTRGVQ